MSNPANQTSKEDLELSNLAVVTLNSCVRETRELTYGAQLKRFGRVAYIYLAPTKDSIMDGEFTVVVESRTGLVLGVAKGILPAERGEEKWKKINFAKFDKAVSELQKTFGSY